MNIRKVMKDDELPTDLLLLADPSIDMVTRYVNKGESYVAEIEDMMAGVYVLLPISTETVEIVNIAVAEEHQGQGIGKRLLQHAISTAAESGYRTIEIRTGNSSIFQLKLYQKAGFRIIDVDRDFFVRNYDEAIYENGIQCRDQIRLSLELNTVQREFPIIETERLILREVTLEDAEDMFVYLSDPDVVRHMGLEPYQSVKDIEDEIRWYQSIYKEGTGIRWGVTLRDSGRMIGSCVFLNRVPKHHRAEAGFEISKAYWGKGMASEALKAVVPVGFQHYGLERIEALIEPENTPSQRLVERHGFVREGLLRHYEYTCGKFDDLYMYSILKGD